MTSTVTALFDRKADAEAAENRLKAANIDAGHIRIHDKTSPGFHATGGSTTHEPGIWGAIKHAFLPDEDRHTYEEGVRRGGFLLTADVDEDHVDDAVRVLEESDTVDIDDRAQQWRSSGWDYAPATMAGADTALGDGHAFVPPAATGDDAYLAEPEMSGDAYPAEPAMGDAYAAEPAADRAYAADEQRIPIVQESLIVGKRDVDRGGARVRSYVTETPVHEQVRLRDEQINVERRAVDRPLTDADDAFRERTIDVTATGEEAVVSKTARVVEEVVVSKTSGERVQDIDDSVRRTQVDVDEDKGAPIDPSYAR